jgi:hypothetical protein
MEDQKPVEVEPGEIVVDEAGNIVIGAPTATAFGEAPLPSGEEGDE